MMIANVSRPKWKMIAIIFLIAFCAGACTIIPEQAPTQTIEVVATDLPEISTATVAVVDTPTAVSEETEPTPLIELTETINSPDLPEQLLDISEEGQIPDTFKGNLLLNDLITNSAITIDFSQASRYPIVPEPDSSIKWVAISPDNDKAFYIRLGTETTFGDGIMSFAEDEPTIQIDIEDCLWFKGWLDNNHILCFDDVYRKVNISTGRCISTTAVFNRVA